ncbi:hypothetical protein JY651_35180 [Pyxidicoccus parkwayensis]|uniref:Uncharacterized protein n=1 Tax=Pyxidicoccus parkwayensis TaxID=2813578 RepID=A0ABX7NNM1_9BACT|nr:hypothetical protein [Pyxidicoccus parkwaysis]QSQ20459.1 hypothetical protein JY651_35180 [Pyxidicoccus parkwaysis]
MSLSTSGRTRPWRLRGRPLLYEVTLGGRPSEDATASQVPPELVSWHLDHWLTCARGTLLEMFAALGGSLPWSLTSLERSRNDRLVRERLARAFELGELVAFRVEETVGAWTWPEPEPLRPEPPAPRPAREEEAPFAEPAMQALALKRAAEQGVPFCEECEKRKRQREQEQKQKREAA